MDPKKKSKKEENAADHVKAESKTSPDLALKQKTEHDLKIRNAILDSLLTNLPIIITKVNKDGIVTESLGSGLKMIQMKENELSGKNLFEVQPDAHNVRKVLETGISHNFIGTVKLAHEVRYFQNYFFSDGEKGVVGFSIDITSQKLAEETIKESEEKLLKLNSALEQKVTERTQALSESEERMRVANHNLLRINNDLDNFIYTASHDLKAPVSNVEGLITTLIDILPAEVVQNESVKGILGMINLSIGKFKGTIHDLSDISKIQKNVSEDVEEITIREIVEDVKLDLREHIGKSRAQISLEMEDSLSIKFSRKNLKSIIYNLLSNSIKYKSPERDPIVEITVKKEEEQISLLVKDNGLGFKMDHADKIFSMFKRLHDHVDGTGVGLYIVKKIVDNTGGGIEVESEINKGTIFKIVLKGQ